MDYEQSKRGLFACLRDGGNETSRGEFQLALHENAFEISDQCNGPDENILTKDTAYDFTLLVGG